MFIDYVYCDYPLPMAENEGNIQNPPNWSEVEFQTFSFSNKRGGGGFSKFTIENDGQLYKEILEDGHETGIEKQEYTGELDFYTVYYDKEKDFWVEFKALYWKGDLKELTLEKWQEKSQKKRKEIQEKISHSCAAHVKKKKKWWYNFYKVYSFSVGSCFFIIKYILHFIFQVVSWIEEKIT